jgi:hypothetical protein
MILGLLLCLEHAGLHEVVAAILRADSDDMAAVLFDQTDRVPVTGRQIYFKTAIPWVARALVAETPEEAKRWAKKAGYELERYRDSM